MGVPAGALAGAGTVELLDAPIALAAGVAFFAALATGLSLWSIPRLNALLGEETASVGFAAVGGGVGGGIAALATLLPVFVTEVPFDVRLAIGLLTFTVGLTGFAGAAALVVVRLSLADREVRIDEESAGRDTGLVEAVRTRSGEFYVYAGGLVALAGAIFHFLEPVTLDPHLSGTIYGGIAMAGGGLLGYGAARMDRSSSGGSRATS
ncbi:hypothetical protein BRD00_13055 [Halobacteriales archaeon QS_8_69_26]|nr:MAG: hypothetical protein BRD00_13055 [Halobacteriales archaeon QS_8_69_26]